MILHLTGIGAFALVAYNHPQPAEWQSFETWWEKDETVVVDTVLSGVPRIAPTSAAEAPLNAFEPSAALVTSGSMDLPGVIAGMPGGSSTSVVNPAADLKVGHGVGTGIGNGVGKGTGTGSGGAGFFGLRGTAEKVVYVVDCSRSMNHPHPGPTRTRIGRVKLELLKSVRGLNENQKFFIIFFNYLAFPMPSDRMMEATDPAKLKYLRWMAEARAEGTTEPKTALMFALQLNPDIIYFLTDGDFEGHIVKEVAIANRGRIKINTIGFGDNRGEKLLKLIAEQSGGQYQFIPPDEVPPEEQAAAATAEPDAPANAAAPAKTAVR